MENIENKKKNSNKHLNFINVLSYKQPSIPPKDEIKIFVQRKPQKKIHHSAIKMVKR